jgi:hypothetical protein
MPINGYVLMMSPVGLVIDEQLELALPPHSWVDFGPLQAWC